MASNDQQPQPQPAHPRRAPDLTDAIDEAAAAKAWARVTPAMIAWQRAKMRAQGKLPPAPPAPAAPAAEQNGAH